MKKISLVAALSENYVIGINNKLPWHLPDDWKNFKQITSGKTVIMGRKTYQSIGRPLPNRQNIIITNNQLFTATGCSVANSIEQALELADSNEIMVIGGATIYSECIDLADTMYLTIVHTQIRGDTYFPKWDENAWREVSRSKHAADELHAFAFSFITLNRVN